MPIIDDFTIRPLDTRDSSTRDRNALIALHNSYRPDTPLTPLLLDELAKRHEGEPYVWFGLERDGTFIGASHYRLSTENSVARRFIIDLFVDPLWHNQGLEQDLLDHLEAELASHDPRELAVRLREDDVDSYDFFAARDFSETERRYNSRLDLARTDLSHLPTLPDDLSLRSFADLPASEPSDRALYTLMIELLRDVPWSGGFQPWPFETWRERFTNSPMHLPDGIFIAFEGDEMVGLTMLYKSDTPGLVRTGLTGVRAPYRRRGIALALKAAALRYAHAHGYDTVITTNHAVNKTMLGLNAQLGFVRDPAWLLLAKAVATPDAARQGAEVHSL